MMLCRYHEWYTVPRLNGWMDGWMGGWIMDGLMER